MLDKCIGKNFFVIGLCHKIQRVKVTVKILHKEHLLRKLLKIINLKKMMQTYPYARMMRDLMLSVARYAGRAVAAMLGPQSNPLQVANF